MSHEADLSALLAALENGPCVRVTVIGVKGSAPRAPGAAMLVHAGGLSGSIGGGRLEFAAEKIAREMLMSTDARTQFTDVHGLGPDHEQCCGGAVTLLFQRFGPEARGTLRCALQRSTPLAWQLDITEGASPLPFEDDLAGANEAFRAGGDVPRVIETATGRWWVESPHPSSVDLVLFGAGHVGRALVPLLAGLPIRVHWFDPRADRLPEPPPAQVVETHSDDPLALVAGAADDALFLVMTHSHPLDEEICHAVLERGHFGWLGLIGSKSKRARFVHRLARRGIDPERLERLQCPVGLPAVAGKRPATIALSIAAQLAAEHLPDTMRW